MKNRHVYPKRIIFHMLLRLAWERGDLTYAGRLSKLFAVGVAVLSLLVALVPATIAQQATAPLPPSAFSEGFDGAPSAPQAYRNPHNWDIMVFGVDARQPNLAQHGPNCEAPGFPYTPQNSHTITSPSDAVFICNNHVMTAPGISGYGAVYMTPPAVADFSAGSARISWDMSTLRTSSRDWVYVTLTPFDEHHEMPYINTDQHVPPRNIKIALGGVNTFEVFQNGGFQDSKLAQQDDYHTWDDVFAHQSTPVVESASRRDTFEITLSATAISLCMPNYLGFNGEQPFCWARDVPLREPLDPAIWHGQATVQFTHVVYNAEKSCEDGALANGYDANTVLDQFSIVHNAYGDLHCPPNTWHWDNVSIVPSVAYSVIESSPSDFTSTSGSAFTVSFAQAAPAGAFLSFVSWGDTPQLAISFDRGATWQAPHLQAATALQHPEVGENVVTAIPPGQQSVMVRGARGYWGSFEAQSFKIVVPPAVGALAGPTAIPTAVAAPTAPTTPFPPPPIATAAPTALPATVVPATAVPEPTAIAISTPEPSCSFTVTVGGARYGGVCAPEADTP